MVSTQTCNLLCMCPTMAISDRECLGNVIVRKEKNDPIMALLFFCVVDSLPSTVLDESKATKEQFNFS